MLRKLNDRFQMKMDFSKETMTIGADWDGDVIYLKTLFSECSGIYVFHNEGTVGLLDWIYLHIKRTIGRSLVLRR